MKYENRRHAGRQLVAKLRSYMNLPNPIVLALPRGGVPVAYEVAQALRAPLDVFLVRKLGVPCHPELAMGAIAEGGVQVLNQHLIEEARISPSVVEQIVARERMELERRTRSYRAGRPRPSLKGRNVILVDDGLATGATMEAAVRAVRKLTDGKIIVAVPVGAAETCQRLHAIADDVVCPLIPEVFSAVGLWYQHFDQISDVELKDLLGRGSQPPAGAGNPGERRERRSGVRRIHVAECAVFSPGATK